MNNDLSAALHAHVSTLMVDPSESALETAQRKLDARLSELRRAPVRRPWIGWIAAAATACLVLTLSLLPVSRGVAFATVQKHLIDFSTLTLVIDQQSQGMTMPGIRVRMNREGDVRTDIGEASSTVINLREHRMLTLLHDSHGAMQLPLDATVVHHPGDNLRWLEAIRDFQGKAERLSQVRIIDGQRTTGWSFTSAGVHVVLWADAEGLPRAVEVNDGQLLRQRMHVTVDTPIDAAVFSTNPPAGYHLLGSEER